MATRFTEGLFVVLVLFQFLPLFSQADARQRAHLLHPSPLTGIWHVDSALMKAHGQIVNLPVLTGEGQPMTALSLEPGGNAFARSADGRLWRCFAIINPKKHTLALEGGYFDGERFDADYTVAQPDESHMVLTPASNDATTHATLTLSRMVLPTSYPLLDRRFHWVSEWGFWR